MDKTYKITNVQSRDPWTGKFGTFNAFALQLEGNEGWVEISQKPETAVPVVGMELFGHIEVQTHGDNTYQKFKKANQQNAPQQLSAGSISKEDVAYLILMLEELTLRRPSPDNPTPRDDVLPTDEDMEKPFTLAEIPFGE